MLVAYEDNRSRRSRNIALEAFFFDRLVVTIVTLLKSRSIDIVSLACFMGTSNMKEIGCDMHILKSADNAYPKYFCLNPLVHGHNFK